MTKKKQNLPATVQPTATASGVFESQQIRRQWDEKGQDWRLSIVDIIAVLTESTNPKRYWNDLKTKLKIEGFETSDFIVRLKMPAPDGKIRLTDTVNTKGAFRIIQSVPSPKAEPFKQWLAKLGHERLEEMANPELGIDRAIDRAEQSYLKKGYSKSWVGLRINSKAVRKELSSDWGARGIQNEEFGKLTNELSKATTALTPQEYKELKQLEGRENLRDHMTPLELAITMLSETSTIEINESQGAAGYQKCSEAARIAGSIANAALQAIEKQTGKPVISPTNFKHLKRIAKK